MVKEYKLRLLPVQAANEQSIIECVAKEKGIDSRTIKGIRIIHRSIDARQRTIVVNLDIQVYINEMPPANSFTPIEYHDVSIRKR